MAEELTRLEELAGMNECYLLCSAAGRVKFASGMLKNLLSEDLTGRNLNDFLEDRLAAHLVSETQARRECTFDCRIAGVHFTGKTYWWEDDDGIEILLYPSALNHSHDRWTDPEQLLFITRELNIIMGGMLPTADGLAESVAPEAQARADALRRSIFRMMRMTRDLEDSVSLAMGLLIPRPAAIDLTALCAELLDRLGPMCRERKIALHRTLPEGKLECVLDPEMFTRMICHLVSNAVQAQPEGGAIDVVVRADGQSEVTVTVTDQGSRTRVIPESTLRRRSPGELLTAPGVGLGLPLTRAFAECQGGRLLLMSSGKGSLSAKIILPRTQELRQDAAMSLACDSTVYGTGIDMVLVEMSPVAGASFYRKGR